MTIINRTFATESDYSAMRRLATEIIAKAGLPAYATIGDLDWWRQADSDPAAAILGVRLWLDDAGNALGFAWPAADQVDILIHPDYPTLVDAALAWAEDHHRQTAPEGSEVPLRAWSFSGDTARIRALETRDYHRTDGCLVYYAQTLLANPPAPSLPTGYSITHVQSIADVTDRAAVQRAAFGSEFMTIEKQRAVMAAATYRPELDIAIRAPDGRFAAFALVWLDEANHLGVFEPVGVAADQQRLGLGRAVMLAGLGRLQALGAHRAVVQTGVQNEAARALYEAVGFMELDRCYAWVRRRPQTQVAD